MELDKAPDDNIDILFYFRLSESFAEIRQILLDAEKLRNLAGPENFKEADRIYQRIMDTAMDCFIARGRSAKTGEVIESDGSKVYNPPKDAKRSPR